MAPVGQACTFRAIEDPLLGPVVSFGLAGDAVNLLDDWAHRVPPLSGADLHDFVRGPRRVPETLRLPGPARRGRCRPRGPGRTAGTAQGQRTRKSPWWSSTPSWPAPRGALILAADVRIANAAQRTDSARRAMRS